MKSITLIAFLVLALLLACVSIPALAVAQDDAERESLDQRVRDFLDNARWGRGNIPKVDGQRLHDLIVEGGYKRAVEVGTSTGHSTIWIAWALSKTGGRLITIEIDEPRYRDALANLEEAGLSSLVDARLADAHEHVPQLQGPFDFAFVDADKAWYVQYFQSLLPELEVSSCFTAHNVSESFWRGWWAGTGAFVEELLDTPGLDTEFFTRGAGLSISHKRSAGW